MEPSSLIFVSRALRDLLARGASGDTPMPLGSFITARSSAPYGGRGKVAAGDENAVHGEDVPGSRDGERKRPDRDVGHALRSVYVETVNEDIPTELLDLLGKLD